jgi:hypothetical protein
MYNIEEAGGKGKQGRGSREFIENQRVRWKRSEEDPQDPIPDLARPPNYEDGFDPESLPDSETAPKRNQIAGAGGCPEDGFPEMGSPDVWKMIGGSEVRRGSDDVGR